MEICKRNILQRGGYNTLEDFKKICSAFKFNKEFLDKSYNSLSGGEKTIVNRCFLDKVITKTIFLEKGKTKIYFGNYSFFIEEDERRTLRVKSIEKRLEKDVLTIKNLNKNFGEKIHLKGSNGAGKSTLIKMILGEIKIGPSTKIGYIPQEIKFILVLQKTNFLILDEPTNHLDISTREILEDTLEEYKGTILFVSHDRYFSKK